MDNYTMDELILAFALKFENNAPVILQRLFEGTPVSVEEIDEILKKVEEKYVVITSDDYPDFFHRVDNPPFVFFYEGNLELFDQCDHYFEKTVDGRKCYLAINQKGNDVDWCIVTENERQLVPEINKFFEDYGDRYNLKNYVKNENKVLLLLEWLGEMLVTCLSLIFSDFNINKISNWSSILLIAFIIMILYEIYWIRYFKSNKTMKDMYSSLLGIPVAGATLPVVAFLLLGIYGRNIFLIISTIVLGIGHIGIHLNHKKELE